MPTARQFAAAAVLSGSIYVMGGCTNITEDRGECNLVECYIPNQNKWISIAPMNEIRYAAAAGVANGCLFVFGGAGKDKISSTIERYDPKEDKWTMVIFNSYPQIYRKRFKSMYIRTDICYMVSVI